MNRVLIKSQAKQIIKGNVWALFFIAFIVQILTGINTVYDIKDTYDEGVDNFSNYSDEYDGYFYDDGDNTDSYGDYGNSDSSDDYYGGFTGAIKPISATVYSGVSASVISIVSLIFIPTTVTLMGYYVLVIRGRKVNFKDGMSYVFSNAFSENYFKLLLLEIFQFFIIVFFFMLLIIPGIIKIYEYYFAEQIMCENPKMKPSQAMKLSKKMTYGAKSDLFMLDLSFLGWFILCAVTLGIASIYVTPYYLTTKSLYYQNYKVKLLGEGRITEDDFLSDDERNAKYQGFNPYAQYGNPYAAPYGSNYQNPYNQQPTYYQPPTNDGFNNNPNGTQYGNPYAQTNTYQNPQPNPNQYSAPNVNGESSEKSSEPTFSEATYSTPVEPEFTEPQEPKDSFVESTEPEEQNNDFTNPTDTEYL